ncbi:uncharacterized protein LOC103697533 [Phoenix dactylifera]|uniref:Uncharacterized protein LOC103697533 n=1 Tax=Phoenix dactylifera TaxID=42345 RepID=A0A8B8ZSG2_PHODC|nr:uncharacterized protein LOC103697533 [Phoenix dactylifera]
MSSLEAQVLGPEMGPEEDESPNSDLGDIGIECSDEAMDGPETPTGKDGEMIESYDRRELIVNEGDRNAEPFVGMEFDGEEAARAYYNAYACRVGFRVRVSRCHRSMRDGSIICRRFVCSKEGFYIQKGQARSKRQRIVTRVGCMAMLVVKRQSSGSWLVTKFVKEHNHEPVAPRQVALKPRMLMEVKKVEVCLDEKENPVERGLVVATLPQGTSDLEPYEGMQFQSEEAARTFYYAYAEDMGFTVRISKCRRARDGSIICRRFVCSKEGYYVRKYGRTKRSRALTRVGCLARLVVKKLDSGIWVVANFEREHNHPPFVVGNELSYQPPKPTRRINCGARASLPVPSAAMLNIMQDSQSSVNLRFNRLHQEGIRFAEEGATSVEIFNVAMFALREATQKVIAAKDTDMLPQLGNLVSGGNTDRLSWTNDSVNQITMGNQQCSKEVRQVAASNGPKLMQQPLNVVLIAPGLPNESGQAPSATNFPNGQAVLGGLENQQLNMTIPVSVQKQLSPTAHRLDGNASPGTSMSVGRKRRCSTSVDGMDSFITVRDVGERDSKQDGAANQPQGWNILGMAQADSHCGNGGMSTSMALSDAQVAALQAVAEAFNVPTMGATSSFALPIKVLPLSDKLSEGNKGYLLPYCSPSQSLEVLSHQYEETPKLLVQIH